MTTKRILFEGQDVSLGTTMQKLQQKAETMHDRNLAGISKEISSSKELKKQLEDQISQRERAQKIGGRSSILDIQEEYRERKRLAESFEREEETRLRARGVKGQAFDDAMSNYRDTVTNPRMLAADDIRDTKLGREKEGIEEQRTTNILLREILNQDTTQWEQEVNQDRKSVERFVASSNRAGIENLPPEERAKAMYQQALLNESSGGGGGRGSILKDILGAGLIRDLGGILQQMPNAGDGLDLVPSNLRIGGGAAGAAIGNAVGGDKGTVVGAEIGSTLMGVAGNSIMRFFNEREEAEKGRLALKGLTGFDSGSNTIEGINSLGISSSEGFQIAREMALRSGNSSNDITALLGAERGFSIDRGTLMDFTKSGRRTGGSFRDNASSLLGAGEANGIDRVLMNELVQNQTQLINSLGQMTEKVDPKNITSLILEMNSLGGGFALKDPRSMGMIQSLQQGLTNPNEFGKAMNLSVLRNINPNGSLVDLLEMEEKGFSGDKGREFLKGTVNQFNQMFNDEDLTILALRSRFPQIPISDLRRLARGEDVLGSIDSGASEGVDMSGQGNVSMRAGLNASVKDAFVKGPIEGLMEVQEQFVGYFVEVFKMAATTMGSGVTDLIGNALNPRPNNP